MLLNNETLPNLTKKGETHKVKIKTWKQITLTAEHPLTRKISTTTDAIAILIALC
jgi:hypothetical protein